MLPETAWQEEWQISPDCKSSAAVSALEDGTFTVRLNGALWETRTDKMYNCQFAPDGRLTALSQSDGEWAGGRRRGKRRTRRLLVGNPVQQGRDHRRAHADRHGIRDAGRRRAVGTALHRRHRFRPFGNRQNRRRGPDRRAWPGQSGRLQQGHLYHRRRRPSMGRVLPERVVALLRQGRPPGRQHRARHAVRIYHFHQRPALERNLPLCVGTHLRAQIRRRHRAHPQGRQMGPRPQRLPLLEAHVRAVLGASGRRHRRRIHLGRRRAFLRRLHRGLQRHPVELPFSRP